MRSALSSRQFHEKLRREGGFSVRLPSGRTPHRGWLVSVHGHEKDIPESDLTTHEISEYRQQHWHHLHETKRYMGGWMDRGRHQAVLDESERHFSQGIALRRAAEEHQRAIIDLATGHIIHTAGPGAIGQVEVHPHLTHLQRGRR